MRSRGGIPAARTCPDDRLPRIKRADVDLKVLRPVLPFWQTLEFGSAVRNVGREEEALLELKSESAYVWGEAGQ